MTAVMVKRIAACEAKSDQCHFPVTTGRRTDCQPADDESARSRDGRTLRETRREGGRTHGYRVGPLVTTDVRPFPGSTLRRKGQGRQG